MKGAKTVTNAEKINNMTNADLFRILATIDKCDCCNLFGEGCVRGLMCPVGIKEWLESEIDSSGILQPFEGN